jgi:hypothetical protein
MLSKEHRDAIQYQTDELDLLKLAFLDADHLDVVHVSGVRERTIRD